MRQITIYLFFPLFIFIVGCSSTAPAPIKIEESKQNIDFLHDVKPILDKRCVTCHSCYNSPCQAKFSSYEGIDRGANKEPVYNALRFTAMNPTRLFVDAQTTPEWRKKGFFSLTTTFDANASYNDSILMHMIHDKKVHPEIIGSYKPEHDKLICPRNLQEMGDYLDAKPNHGMPYGFPALKDKEYNTLKQWVAKGAHGPTFAQQKKLITPSSKALIKIKEWETFFNKKDAKHVMSARYLYEHLFLAHLHFKNTKREFYKLVRSRTPFPQDIDIIATDRPFSDPKVPHFYYRFQKIHATIVHKTHMVFELDDTKLARFNELFIHTPWIDRPHVMSYEAKTSANPFVTYAQIPPKSRYQFLLDNSEYIVRTFIRGPVCRGQMALNVIHDHFWVMFKDPEYDISVNYPNFLLREAQNLSMPIESSNKKILETFSDAYRQKYINYFKQKQIMYSNIYPNGQGLESIWKGTNKKSAPLLTVYRHFDSASVHRGVLGQLPRTIWVIDYPQFERIYYSLVAGYNVFGNISHQTNIRRYMDFLRLEGELNFLSYMPKEIRKQMLTSWYLDTDMIEDIRGKSDNKDLALFLRNNPIKYKTVYPKDEFVTHIVKEQLDPSLNINFDTINYHKEGTKPTQMPKKLTTIKEIQDAARSLTKPGTNFIKNVTDKQANTILVRLILPNHTSIVVTLVINRWHDNVNSMFDEEDTLDANKDTIDFVIGSIGSYPNLFAIVKYKDLKDFFDLIENFTLNNYYKAKFNKYFVHRWSKNFWSTYEWFQNYFNQNQPIKSGLYDLNRYYHK